MNPILGTLLRVALGMLLLGGSLTAVPAHVNATAGPLLAGPALSSIRAGGSAASGRLGSLSSNWSGYVVEDGPVTSISGQWRVPRVTATGRNALSALWIGIDGVSDRNLIQTGTVQEVIGGVTHYFAWWEVLPAPAIRITSFTVKPGDLISAAIRRLSAGRWRITISTARGGTFSITRAYAGSATSGEWIEEAPQVNGRIARLATHGTVTFDHGLINATNPHLRIGERVSLVQFGSPRSTPSAPDKDRDGFSIGQGATAPAPPPS